MLPAEAARSAVTIRQKTSKLGRKLRFIAGLAIIFVAFLRRCLRLAGATAKSNCFVACLAIPVTTGLRRCLRLAGATAKINCFDHLFEWEFSSPSKMLGNLRMQ